MHIQCQSPFSEQTLHKPAHWGKAMTEKPSSMLVTYIVTSPEKLWEALTNGRFSKQYFFGRRMESDWKGGAPFPPPAEWEQWFKQPASMPFPKIMEIAHACVTNLGDVWLNKHFYL
jgi:hypothetical protein